MLDDARRDGADFLDELSERVADFVVDLDVAHAPDAMYVVAIIVVGCG